MKPEFLDTPLIKNEELNRFMIEVDGFTAFIDYKEEENVITLIHTDSPKELEGRGVANALVEKTLEYIKENNYTLVPLCPFVFAYIKRNPDWKSIIDPNFKMEI